MSEPTEAHELTLPDSRRLAWAQLGDPAGRPVVGLHGSAGSHRQLRLVDEDARGAGVRLIAMDRPGYGRSTHQPARDLLATGRDVMALADGLDLERFGLLGVSAGGPNALATAFVAGERITAVSVMSCVGPVRRPARAPGLQGAARAAFSLARINTGAVRAAVAPLMSLGRHRPATLVDLRAQAMAPVDREVLARRTVRELYEAEARHASSSAPAAFAVDLSLLAREWPFDVGGITAHVHLWHGELDHEAPMRQAEALADALPASTLHRAPSGGHLSFVDHLGDALLAAAEVRHRGGTLRAADDTGTP